MTNDTDPPESPSNTELAVQVSRVESEIDHQREILERIEGRLEEDHHTLRTRIDVIEPKHQRLWLTYQASKWIVGLGSGGGILGLVVQGTI